MVDLGFLRAEVFEDPECHIRSGIALRAVDDDLGVAADAGFAQDFFQFLYRKNAGVDIPQRPGGAAPIENSRSGDHAFAGISFGTGVHQHHAGLVLVLHDIIRVHDHRSRGHGTGHCA